jgi:hypothetical protein
MKTSLFVMLAIVATLPVLAQGPPVHIKSTFLDCPQDEVLNGNAPLECSFMVQAETTDPATKEIPVGCLAVMTKIDSLSGIQDFYQTVEMPKSKIKVDGKEREIRFKVKADADPGTYKILFLVYATNAPKKVIKHPDGHVFEVKEHLFAGMGYATVK